jgi:lipid A 3-O-deacylase
MMVDVRALLSTLVVSVAALGAAAAESRADTRWFHEVKFGILAHDVDHLWSGFHSETAVAINGEVLLTPSMPLLGGTLRPAIGFSVAVNGGRVDQATSKVYGGGRWEYENQRGWFAGVGLGLALHDGNLAATAADRKALGSRVLFHIPFELGVRYAGNRSLSIYFDHTSNAGLRKPNEGLDTLGVRYGYRF